MVQSDRLLALLAEFEHRELPTGYALLTPAAEVAALLKEQAAERESWERKAEAREREWVQLVARVTGIAYLLDSATARFQEPLEAAGLRKIYRELRVLKGQLNQVLAQGEFAWDDPTGRPFDGPLVDQVRVDGWRYADSYAEASVAQVREAIVLHRGVPVREGAVTVGAPVDESEGSDSMSEARQSGITPVDAADGSTGGQS